MYYSIHEKQTSLILGSGTRYCTFWKFGISLLWLFEGFVEMLQPVDHVWTECCSHPSNVQNFRALLSWTTQTGIIILIRKPDSLKLFTWRSLSWEINFAWGFWQAFSRWRVKKGPLQYYLGITGFSFTQGKHRNLQQRNSALLSPCEQTLIASTPIILHLWY